MNKRAFKRNLGSENQQVNILEEISMLWPTRQLWPFILNGNYHQYEPIVARRVISIYQEDCELESWVEEQLHAIHDKTVWRLE